MSGIRSLHSDLLVHIAIQTATKKVWPRNPGTNEGSLLSWMQSMRLELASSEQRSPWWQRRGLVSVVSEFRNHPILYCRLTCKTWHQQVTREPCDSANENCATGKGPSRPVVMIMERSFNIEKWSISLVNTVGLCKLYQSELDSWTPPRYTSSIKNIMRLKMNYRWRQWIWAENMLSDGISVASVLEDVHAPGCTIPDATCLPQNCYTSAIRKIVKFT